MLTVNVDLGDRSYPIYIGTDLLSREDLLSPYLGKGRVVIVSNDVVAPLYMEKARMLFASRGCEQIILEDGEENKNNTAIKNYRSIPFCAVIPA